MLYSFCASANCADGAYPDGSLIIDDSKNLYGTTSYYGAKYNQLFQEGGTVFTMTYNAATKAYKQQTLYSFCAQVNCKDGADPVGNLVRDASGNLFGVTQSGGDDWGGTIYKLAYNAGNGKYTYQRLYSFCAKPDCIDGYGPIAGLIMDGMGNLFGTTQHGGAIDPCAGDTRNGCGTVFELKYNSGTGKYTYTVIYSFCSLSNCVDGYQPEARLTMDAQSNIYGTTYYGGAESLGFGTVFKLSLKASGKYTFSSVYSFCHDVSCSDGERSMGGVVVDSQHNLYGLSNSGGAHSGGVAYMLKSQPNGSYVSQVLYSFCSVALCADGFGPTGELFMDSLGNLFGTAAGGPSNGGLVFQLSPTGGGQYQYQPVRTFCQARRCTDGSIMHGVIGDGAGHLFGVTEEGGKIEWGNGAGTVFELTLPP